MTYKDILEKRLEMKYLTIDYRGTEEVYADHVFPIGTIACDVLNITAPVVDQLITQSEPMYGFVDGLYNNEIRKYLMAQSGKNALEVVDLLAEIPPFSYHDHTWLREKVERIFSPEGVKKASLAIQKATGPGALFIQSLGLVSQLAHGIKDYQKALIPLVESMDDGEVKRDIPGYVKQFDAYFSSDGYGQDYWMTLANVSMQYIADGDHLARRMHYASFPSMFRSNFFEALNVGHAPKRCPICGKFFLTTNARQQKYCNGLAPDDAYGRTCRQLGARLGKERRELASDDPWRVKFRQTVDAIDQRIHRGTLSKTLGEQMKELARNKRDIALMNATYANSAYLTEMNLASLETEAKGLA